MAHGGILLLLAGIMLGNKMTVAVDQVELPQGDRVHEQSLPFDLRLNRFGAGILSRHLQAQIL